MTKEEFMKLSREEQVFLVRMANQIGLEDIAERNGGWEACVIDCGEGGGVIKLWPIGLGFEDHDPNSATFDVDVWDRDSIYLDFELGRDGWYAAWTHARAKAGDSGGITLLSHADPVEPGFLKLGRAA